MINESILNLSNNMQTTINEFEAIYPLIRQRAIHEIQKRYFLHQSAFYTDSISKFEKFKTEQFEFVYSHLASTKIPGQFLSHYSSEEFKERLRVDVNHRL